ncbi:MAG: TonB-dependent receptor [Bacteroidaceae bacterium]
MDRILCSSFLFKITDLKIIVCLLWFFSLMGFAQKDTGKDFRLQGARVKGFRPIVPIEKANEEEMVLNMRMLQPAPQLLGSADPLKFVQLMPGVQTNSELVSGLSLQGCDNAHNLIEVAGAPLYNANHLLGFFSIFNASHFRTMTLRKSNTGLTGENRLGGLLSLQPMDVVASRFKGELGVGLIESHATFDIPITSKSTLYLSGRATYINLFYGSILKTDESQLNYSFQDYNATYVWQPDKKQNVLLHFYGGRDHLNAGDELYQMGGKLHWGNVAASASWNRQFGKTGKMKQQLYVSTYQNKLRMGMSDMTILLPSGVTDLGYKSEYRVDLSQGVLHFGLESAYRLFKPQVPEQSGSFNTAQNENGTQTASETSLWAAYRWNFAQKWMLETALRAPFYVQKSYKTIALDPRLAMVHHPTEKTRISASIGVYHQYVHQNVISGIGMPVDAWMPASKTIPASKAFCYTIGATQTSGNDHYVFSVEGFYKILRQQTEYDGSLLDLFMKKYDLEKNILSGHGYNLGVDFFAKKTHGRLTGWVGYTLGWSKRRFPSMGNKWYSSSHERRHDFSIVLNWIHSKKTTFSASFVYASGTPYTAPKYAYIYGENILCEYGEHNGSKMPNYHRLDMSMTHCFYKRKDGESGINLSIYNVYNHKNPLFYYTDFHKLQLKMKTAGLSFNLIPSISYFYKF